MLLLFFFWAGHLNGSLNQHPPHSPTHILTHLNKAEETIVLGRIQQIYGFNGRLSKFDVSAFACHTAGKDFKPINGIIRYSMEGVLPANMIPGQTFAIRGKLYTPQKFATPGSFNYPEYLARKHIYVTSFIKSPLYIQHVHQEQALYQKLLFAPEVLRTKINRFIDNCLEGDQAAVYKALLTGDRASISPNLIESFKGSGCLHILAISGIHMSILGLVLYSFFFWMLCRSTWVINRINTKKTAFCMCIIPLLFYTLIAGTKTPVVRSFVMSLVVIIAILYGKKHSFLSLVTLACLIILSLSPTDIASPSFQLTFAAVISIAAAFPIITSINTAIRERFTHEFIIKILSWMSVGLGVSFAATLGTAPILIYHFNLISLIGFAANLIIEPLICLWSLVIGFIAAPLIFVSPTLAELLFSFGAQGISMAMSSAAYFNSLPHSSLMLPTVSIIQICLYYICLALLLMQHTLSKKFKVILYTVFLLTIFSAIMPVKELVKSFEKESVITYLDVGHGSCTLIETPGGKRILIDGGALSSPGFNIGERVIAPFLLERKILTIDDIIVTHPDGDHYNGIPYILSHFDVENIWVNSKKGHDEGWQRLLETAREVGTRITVPESNQVVNKNTEMSIKVLANTTDATGLSINNDNGLILRYRHGNFTALFPGDISKDLEQKLVKSITDLKATIFLASHHGSSTSNSIEFLSAVQPEVMVVSSGRNEKALFPANAVTVRCNKLNIPYILTNTTGSVTVRTQKGIYDTETYYPDSSGQKKVLSAKSLIHR